MLKFFLLVLVKFFEYFAFIGRPNFLSVSIIYGKPLLPKAYQVVNPDPNGVLYHRVTKVTWSLLEMHGRILENYGSVAFGKV